MPNQYEIRLYIDHDRKPALANYIARTGCTADQARDAFQFVGVALSPRASVQRMKNREAKICS